MTFIPAQSPETPAMYLAGTIGARLSEGRSVLWLLSGGSAISVALATAKLLAGQDLTNLTISLIDERFGPLDHSDSNWHLLEQAGFSVPGATMHPVLTGADRPTTTASFGEFLQHHFVSGSFCLGLLGIGPDGHTSGILPHSPAITASGLAFDYDGPDFQRITTTPTALARLNEAVVYVVGSPKWPVLDQLETDLPPAAQPAQLLKTLPKLTIFTDRPQSA